MVLCHLHLLLNVLNVLLHYTLLKYRKHAISVKIVRSTTGRSILIHVSIKGLFVILGVVGFMMNVNGLEGGFNYENINW